VGYLVSWGMRIAEPWELVLVRIWPCKIRHRRDGPMGVFSFLLDYTHTGLVYLHISSVLLSSI
jgi:hypothetical protein